MWNTSFKEHREKNPYCKGDLICHLEQEDKWGFSSRQCLQCTKCRYMSKHFPLYEEIETGKPGRKAGKCNRAAQVGMSQTPVASTGVRKIFLSANMQAPAASSLQKTSNKVMKEIIKVNKQDMKKRRNEIVEINRLRGKENPQTISIQMDGCYNNRLYSGVGRTPFQPATQTVYTAAENETNEHMIIGINDKNKLCSKHSSLILDPDSGLLHAQCTEECSANIPMVKSIGDEYTWAKEVLTELLSENIEVDFLVTDPDSSAYRAAQDLYEEGKSQTEPEHFLDTRHVSENIRKGIKKDNNLLKAMPAKTKAKQQKLLNNFSTDIAERCNAELKQAHKKCKGDYQKLKCKVSYIVHAIVGCYMGNHDLCKKHSFVCNGMKKLWLKGRSLLPADFKMRNCASHLRKAVNKRLGPSILKKTRMNMNTNFVEGFNRSLRRSLPSNVTYKRNFSGRAHSAVHSVNFGPGESILELCSALHFSIPVGSSAFKALKSIQKIDILQKQHKKTVEYQRYRSEKRNELYKLYERLGEMIQYEKNMLLKCDEKTKPTPQHKDEHSYSKNSLKKRKTVRK